MTKTTAIFYNLLSFKFFQMLNQKTSESHSEDDCCRSPITAKQQMELNVMDDSIYNSLLKSWKNGTKTPTDAGFGKETDDANSKIFVTPTKVFDYNNEPASSSCDNSKFNQRLPGLNEDLELKIKSVLSLDNMSITQGNGSSSPVSNLQQNKQASLDPTDPLPGLQPKQMVFDNEFAETSRRNSVPRVSLSSVHYNVSTSPGMLKSVSANSISKNKILSEEANKQDSIVNLDDEDNVNKNSGKSTSILVSTRSNSSNSITDKNANMITKNKNSIYKQFKKFNWRELTPTKNNYNVILQQNGGSRNNSLSSANIPVSILLGEDEANKNSFASLLTSTDEIINGNDLDDDLHSLYDEALGDNVMSADVLNKRSWNPRSSFSSSLDFSNYKNTIDSNGSDALLHLSDVERGISFSNFNNPSKKDSYPSNSGYSSTARGSYANTNTNSDVRENSMGVQQSPLGTSFSIPPPLLLKQKFTNISLTAKSFIHSKPPLTSKKRFDINLLMPYTNDNFDQCIGMCALIENAKKYDSNYNFNLKLTLSYVACTQEELLIKDISQNLKITTEDAKTVLGSFQFPSKTGNKALVETRFPFLANLAIDQTPSRKVKLLQSVMHSAGVADANKTALVKKRDDSILSNATTLISSRTSKESDDSVSEVSFFDKEIAKRLTIPYLPVIEGKSYAPKTLTIFLSNYKHFNVNNSLSDYLQTMEKLFTEKEDVFLNMWKHALRDIDNDNGVYHEYNLKHVPEGPVISKLTFYKPSYDLQIVIDEYFTAYNKEKFDSFWLYDCFLNKDGETSANGSQRRSSFVRTYDTLSRIFKGEKQDYLL